MHDNGNTLLWYLIPKEFRNSNSSTARIFCNPSIVIILGKRVKDHIRKQFKALMLEQHKKLEANPKVNVKINTTDLRCLTTKWLGEAWDKILADPEFMIGTFKRTGLSLPLDGSEDAEAIRFDGQGVDPVSVDSDSEPEEGAEPDADEYSDLEDVMSDNEESDYTDGDE